MSCVVCCALGALCDQFRGKLLTLLRTSMYYDAISLLDFLLRCPTLFEERVVLYQRVGDHRRALGLLVYELADHPKAEAYCVEQYNRTCPVFVVVKLCWCCFGA